MSNQTRIEYIVDGKNKTKKVFSEVNSDLSRSGSNVKSFNTNMSAGISTMKKYSAVIGTAVVASMTLLIKKTIDQAESLEKMSQRVGVSVENLSTLRYAAELSGTEIGVFEKAVQRASRNITDSAMGKGDAKEIFDKFGISVKDSSGELKSADGIMMEVADRFANMKDGTEKTAAALDVFGRAGADLIPMLNGGSEGLKKMQEEAKALGLEVSTSAAKMAAELKDNMLRLESSVKGIGVTVTTELLPSLIQVTNALVAFAKNEAAVATMSQGIGMTIKILASLFLGVAAGATVAAAGLGTFWAVAAKMITFNPEGAIYAAAEGVKTTKELSLAFGDMFKGLWGDADDYKSIIEKMNKEMEYLL